ncbi:hypothetical protein OIV83_001805 [Microbotryomycetes sp. JL201]|nr:hypothetical protein OIV83_001805 [Microbotryomycetes sp. JL201]
MLRAQRITFKGDEFALQRAYEQTRILFNKFVPSAQAQASIAASLPANSAFAPGPTPQDRPLTSEEVDEHIATAFEIAQYLRKNVVQGVRNETGNYSLRITEDTERGDNASIKMPPKVGPKPPSTRRRRRASVGGEPAAEAETASKLGGIRIDESTSRERSSSLIASLAPSQTYSAGDPVLPSVGHELHSASAQNQQHGRPRAGTFPSSFHLNPAASSNQVLRQMAGGRTDLLAPPATAIATTMSLPGSGRTTPISEIPSALTNNSASFQGSGSTPASSVGASLGDSRLRSGSLMLSTADVTNAFESTVFPKGIVGSTGADSLSLNSRASDDNALPSSSRIGLDDELKSPESSTYAEDSARTLDFLGLDTDSPITGYGPFGEDKPVTARGAMGGRSSSVSAAIAPGMQRLGSTGSLGQPKLANDLAYQARLRSNTVSAFGRGTFQLPASSFATGSSALPAPLGSENIFSSSTSADTARLLYSTSSAGESSNESAALGPIQSPSRMRSATVHLGAQDEAREVHMRRRAGTATGIAPFALTASLGNGSAFESTVGDFAGGAASVLSRNLRGLTLKQDEATDWSGPGRESPPDPSSASQPYQQPTRSLWIGNLDPRTSPAELQTIFAPYGAIESLRLIPEKECGFVNFVSVQDAIKAKEDVLNRLSGHLTATSGMVRIGFGKDAALAAPASTLAHMRTTAGPVLANNVAPPLAADSNLMTTPTRALWIGSIPPSTTPAQLLTIFAPFGPIESARVLTHKNCGFINFERLDDAVAARKALNGRDILGPETGAARIGFAKVPAKAGTGPLADVTNKPVDINGDQSTSVQDYRSNLMLSVVAAEGEGAILSTATAPVDETKLLMRELGGDRTETELDLAAYKGESRPFSTVRFQAYFPLAGERPSATYYTSIPLGVLSDSKLAQRYTQADAPRLRDLRKRLDLPPPTHEVDAIAHEVELDVVGLSSDYIGNTIIQKIFENASPGVRLMLLERIAPHLAAIGTHKNGTWAAQKIIACAEEPEEFSTIAQNLAPFTPPLLLNDFGNYVVQGCLRFKEPFTDFIFDAMVDRCWEIGSGRFGARSMRQILESPNCSTLNLKRVAIAIILNSIPLATNANGALLITWLLDTSDLPGRFKLLTSRFTPHLAHLCTHKLAAGTVIKMLTQKVDLDSARKLLDVLLDPELKLLEEILADQQNGTSFALRLLTSPNLDGGDRVRFTQRVRAVITTTRLGSTPAYRKLLEEMDNPGSVAPPSSSPDAIMQRQAGGFGNLRIGQFERQQQQHQQQHQPNQWRQQPMTAPIGYYPTPTAFTQPGPFAGHYAQAPLPYQYYASAMQGVNTGFYNGPYSSDPNVLGLAVPGSPPLPPASPFTTGPSVSPLPAHASIGFHPFSPIGSPTMPRRYLSPSNGPAKGQGY